MANNIAFVYHYWNIKNFMSYYGYKEKIIKNYMPKDIFVEHPLGENSTNTHYCSSCKQKRWKEACKRGEIYGEIIAVFTGENAGIIAHEYEHQMIITHKALYGQDTLYNENDGYAKFSTAGITPEKAPFGGHNHTEKSKKQISDTVTEVLNTPIVKERISIGTKKGLAKPETKIKNSISKKKMWENKEKHEYYSKIFSGEGNPASKRKWVTNGIEQIFMLKTECDEFLKNNRDWYYGQSKQVIDKRSNSQKGKTGTKKNSKWMKKNNKSTIVAPDKIDEYLNNGWIFGRIFNKKESLN